MQSGQGGAEAGLTRDGASMGAEREVCVVAFVCSAGASVSWEGSSGFDVTYFL